MAAGTDGVFDCSDVGITLSRSSKEVKNSAVVPDVESVVREVRFEDVALQPGNTSRFDTSQSGSCTIERGSGQVQNCNVTVALSEELVDQEGITTSYVDNPCVFWESCAADKVQ